MAQLAEIKVGDFVRIKTQPPKVPLTNAPEVNRAAGMLGKVEEIYPSLNVLGVRIEGATATCAYLPEEVEVFFDAPTGEECDTDVGPCACGGWHGDEE